MSRPNSNTYWVEPNRLLAGEYPGARDAALAPRRLGAFLEHGITHFIDLTQEGELRPYQRLLQKVARERGVTVEYQRIPIADMSVPRRAADMVAILDQVDAAVASGGTVYVHCLAGIGRTGTAIGCYFVRQGLTGNAALRELARLWPQMAKSDVFPNTPQTAEQRQFVLDWQERDR
jgi:protein-tyrosine phosphatase